MQQKDHQQHQKMGFSGPAGPATGGGASGGVLARFLSAPASWLDALLLEMDEPHPQQQQKPPPAAAAARPPAAPKPKSESLPERPPPLGRSNSISDPTSFLDSAFSRHNSCPPEFLARLASEELFSASDFDASSIPEAPSHKRTRQSELSENPSSQSSAPVSDMELDSLFQDSVPCRVRAKRGCATHPRSIAERVRRTRISDRIRKLQEVVPNMDKQTNTADMLEEAVEYVKTLQKQVQAEFYDFSHPQTWQDLIEHQKKCKCLGSE